MIYRQELCPGGGGGRHWVSPFPSAGLYALSLSMKALLLLLPAVVLCGCAGITATTTRPDGTVDKLTIGSQVSKTTLRNLKSPLLSIQSMGTDMSAQIESLVGAISEGVAQGMAAQAAKERSAQPQ